VSSASALTRAHRPVPRLELAIERFALSCGATLLVSPRVGAPVTAVHIHIRGGPALDPKGLEGTAFLTGTMLDQGTRDYSESKIAELLEPAGGEVAGDAGGIHGTIVGGDWKRLLELMASMLVRPRFPEAQVALHKQRLLDRLSIERDDPRSQGGLLFRRLVYGDHWLGRAAYGTHASVKRIRTKHLREHHARHWVGKRAVIAVCGDIDPEAVRREFERQLRRWNAGTPLVTTAPVLPPRAVRTDAFDAQRQQVHVFLGHLGITRNHPDYAALVVMDHVLGTGPGFTNRISRILRDEQGLCYSVNANIHGSAGILPGMFTAYIGTSPENVATAVQGFLREMRRIRDEPVSAEELEIAKSYLIGSFPLGFERASRRASYLVSHELHNFPADNLDQMLRAFGAVTVADVQRAAREQLHPDQACLAAAGPVKVRQLENLLRDAAR